MRYSLRTLSVLLGVGPVALWGIYSALPHWELEQDDRTNIMQAPRVTIFSPTERGPPTADLDLAFVQAGLELSESERSEPVTSASSP